MKTTLEIPDTLFRQAKSVAAQQGIPFRELVSSALAEKLAKSKGTGKPWMKMFGGLRHLHKETAPINAVIKAEFNVI